MLRWLVAIVIAFFLPDSATYGNSSDCLCPLHGPDENEAQTRVANGSACTSLDIGYGRCNITVHCLSDGRTGPGCDHHSANTGNSGAVTSGGGGDSPPSDSDAAEEARRDVGALFEAFPVLAIQAAESNGIELPFDVAVFSGLIEANGDSFEYCLERFARVMAADPGGEALIAQQLLSDKIEPYAALGVPVSKASDESVRCGVTTLGTLYFLFTSAALDATGDNFEGMTFQFTRIAQ